MTHEHDVEYGIQKPDPKNKSNNESMASDHPYIPPGYNEYTGGPGTAGHYKEWESIDEIYINTFTI